MEGMIKYHTPPKVNLDNKAKNMPSKKYLISAIKTLEITREKPKKAIKKNRIKKEIKKPIIILL